MKKVFQTKILDLNEEFCSNFQTLQYKFIEENFIHLNIFLIYKVDLNPGFLNRSKESA